MIKTAAIFPEQAARNSVPVIAAIMDGLTRYGIQVQHNSRDSDAVIIWSVLWSGRMAANRKLYEHYRSTGRPVIVVDIGTLRRGVTWKIGLDNINRDGWFGDMQDLDSDRPRRLGLRLQTPPMSDHILIAGQHSHSLQTQALGSMEKWVYNMIAQIRRYTDRLIAFRPHPRDRSQIKHLPLGVSMIHPKRIAGTYDSFDWSNQWHAVVNHNSGPGVLAAIGGVRPVVHESSLAWPVAVNMRDIEDPYRADREQWLIEIAHTEYTLDEISDGQWLKRLGLRL